MGPDGTVNLRVCLRSSGSRAPYPATKRLVEVLLALEFDAFALYGATEARQEVPDDVFGVLGSLRHASP